MIYSVVPEEMAPELYDKLVEYYKDDPNVKVIIDRRKSERRARGAAEESEQRTVRDRRRSRHVYLEELAGARIVFIGPVVRLYGFRQHGRSAIKRHSPHRTHTKRPDLTPRPIPGRLQFEVIDLR